MTFYLITTCVIIMIYQSINLFMLRNGLPKYVSCRIITWEIVLNINSDAWDKLRRTHTDAEHKGRNMAACRHEQRTLLKDIKTTVIDVLRGNPQHKVTQIHTNNLPSLSLPPSVPEHTLDNVTGHIVKAGLLSGTGEYCRRQSRLREGTKEKRTVNECIVCPAVWLLTDYINRSQDFCVGRRSCYWRHTKTMHRFCVCMSQQQQWHFHIKWNVIL